ncbi:protein kinase [Candidatus Uhrbacteria bacterium]|nr:protein kinase [Candidatus Uhrbacteria bacterium]
MIDSEVDCGGEAFVYKAYAKSDDRVVAIKLLWKLVDVDELQRFERVREIHGMVNGKNVLPLEQAGIFMDGEDKYPYFVFPFISGGITLERILEESVANLSSGEKLRGTLIPYEDLLHYALEAGNGLLTVHSSGVIHRDVKPSNILVAGKGSSAIVRLMDLGVAKFFEPGKAATDYKLTQQGCFRGTPAYLAPEAAAGKPSVLADIWAFGALMYEMVTGRTAFNFESGNMMSVLAKVVSGSKQPTSIGEYCDHVPHALEALIMKCMKFNPEERPQSMSEVLGELNRMQLSLPHVFKSQAPPPLKISVKSGSGINPDAETMAAPSTPPHPVQVPETKKEPGLRKMVLRSEPAAPQKRLPDSEAEPRLAPVSTGSSTGSSVLLVIGIAAAVVVLYFGYQTWKQQSAQKAETIVPDPIYAATPAKPTKSAPFVSADTTAVTKTAISDGAVASARPVDSAKEVASAEAIEPEVEPEPEKTAKPAKGRGRGSSNTGAAPLAPGIDYIPGVDGP